MCGALFGIVIIDLCLARLHVTYSIVMDEIGLSMMVSWDFCIAGLKQIFPYRDKPLCRPSLEDMFSSFAKLELAMLESSRQVVQIEHA